MIMLKKSTMAHSKKAILATALSSLLLASCGSDQKNAPDLGSGQPSANQAPVIETTSYDCDPSVESIAYTVGETDAFTLTLSGNSLDGLQYEADSSNPSVLGVSVDENGTFTTTALQAGESYLWLTVSNSLGLIDEYEIHAIVE